MTNIPEHKVAARLARATVLGVLVVSTLFGAEDIQLERRVQAMPQIKAAPYTKLGDGSALTVDEQFAHITTDNGKTWLEPIPLFAEGQDLKVSEERVLTRTRDGVVILAFMNLNSQDWGWDDEKNAPDRTVRLDVWTIRSLDEGRTWQDARLIQEGYCGAVRDIVQMSSGRVVVVAQDLLYNPGRHATKTYSSDDEGKTWKVSNTIDLGGRGHHDGSIEATIVERRDHSVWMLLRTNLDYFWEAFSNDQGQYWREMRPTRIDASSSPAYVTRLESGRLVMTWNRLYLEGKTSTKRRAGSYSETMASWERSELSIAFSDDDGASWDAPVVIARHQNAGKSVAYPWIFERSPGELWITTMQGALKCRLFEKDFVK